MMDDLNENIFVSIVDYKSIEHNNEHNNDINNNDNNNISDELNELLNELNKSNINSKSNLYFNGENEYVAKMVDYKLNYKLKDLHLICEYYNLLKQVKINKCNKDEIANIIINFENDTNNIDIVNRRKNMWFYINEMKNDKILKKYILL